MLPAVVTEKLEALPASAGVYLFKDKKGSVVYVGKAKVLRSRVRSYFQEGSSDNRYFIPLLLRTIGDLETIVTASEKEAAILENNLIKEHRPRYNVKLRDDKDYISLRLDTKDEWPRLWVVRRPTPDAAGGVRYFGPYHSATAARRTLHLVNKHFQLRTCSDTEMRSRKRPCLQHQIKRCPAPCVLDVDRAWYDEQVRAVAMFLDGRHDELSRELDDRMKSAARGMHFELAAVYRDQLSAIDKVREEQRVVAIDDVDRDVVGLHREGDLVELALLHVRRGKLADVETFSVKNAEVPDEEVVAGFLSQHYGPEVDADIALPIPDEIIVPVVPDAALGISEWLAERAAAAGADGAADEAADSEWDLPDLFVVDGGKGQLAVALAAARDLGLHDLPIVALAKEKENVMGETLVDRVYLPGQKNPIPLKSHSASMFFLARARDEAHRFSNRARERLGKKKRFKSALDDVSGLGPKTRKALLTHLGSLKAIQAATDDALLAVPGVTARHVRAIRAAFPDGRRAPRPSHD